MNDLIKTAKEYAERKHAEVNHLYDGQPYSHHLAMVAAVACKYEHLLHPELRDLAIASCWCHDLIEDTRETYNDVKSVVGQNVAEIVYRLTNEKGRTRSERANDKYYQGIRESSVAVFVKICDRIANMDYSIMSASKMANMYAKEMDSFIAHLYWVDYIDMFEQLQELKSKATEKV